MNYWFNRYLLCSLSTFREVGFVQGVENVISLATTSVDSHFQNFAFSVMNSALARKQELSS